ncbi:MAG: hypothetical protein ACYTG0_38105, partial [Planctomycetota bacterium]
HSWQFERKNVDGKKEHPNLKRIGEKAEELAANICARFKTGKRDQELARTIRERLEISCVKIARHTRPRSCIIASESPTMYQKM